jgi:hypothetical protein
MERISRRIPKQLEPPRSLIEAALSRRIQQEAAEGFARPMKIHAAANLSRSKVR